MKTRDFFYDLPPELIAQTPLDRRDASRLMTLDRRTGEIGHAHFYNLPEFLRSGDCLILNDSRVLPARLTGERAPGGGACELLLLRDCGDRVWECLARPGRKLRPGTKMIFGRRAAQSGGETRRNGKQETAHGMEKESEGGLSAEIIDVIEGGNRLVRFDYDGIFLEVLERLGKMPLPPYIHAELQDRERYQTVYSRVNGSAAAPTAGLHFTPELLEAVRAKGVQISFVTLHVGLGTFRPVREEEIADHKMHEEYCVVPPETAELVNRTRKAGGRCICVGTTACRTLESHADENGVLHSGGGWTGIFIYPGYTFRVTDALITNFHLPESTLLMLVSAFAGRDQILAAYAEAVRERYRFFSFGDAMLLF